MLKLANYLFRIATMKLTHFLMAILLAMIWGMNFIFVRIDLDQMSPFMLCAIRFTLASMPFVFFIKPPKLHFKWVMAYGMVMFVLQFLLLFIGVKAGMSPGMASFVMQVQIFFTMLFAALLWKEIPSFWQIAGGLIAFLGIGLIAYNLGGSMTMLGFLCVLGSAAAWAFGNVITKTIGKVNIISLLVWGSFVSSIPMILMAFIIDGPHEILASFHRLNWQSMGAILFIVYVATWCGYGIWSWLLREYTVSKIAPFTMLIPIFGILSSVIILGEPLQSWKIFAGMLVIGGLGVNLLGAQLFTRR